MAGSSTSIASDEFDLNFAMIVEEVEAIEKRVALQGNDLDPVATAEEDASLENFFRAADFQDNEFLTESEDEVQPIFRVDSAQKSKEGSVQTTPSVHAARSDGTESKRREKKVVQGSDHKGTAAATSRNIGSQCGGGDPAKTKSSRRSSLKPQTGSKRAKTKHSSILNDRKNVDCAKKVGIDQKPKKSFVQTVPRQTEVGPHKNKRSRGTDYSSSSTGTVTRRSTDSQDDRGGLTKRRRSSSNKQTGSKCVKPKRTIILKDAYIVEKIVDYKVVQQVDTFRVRWKGWSANQDTWEPAKHLSSAASILMIATYLYSAQRLELAHSYLVKYLKLTILGRVCYDDLLLSRLSRVPLYPDDGPLSESARRRMQATVSERLAFADRFKLLGVFSGEFTNIASFLEQRATLHDDLRRSEELIAEAELTANITIENNVDETSLPAQFKYTPECKISPNVTLTPATQSCACPTKSCLGDTCCGREKTRDQHYTKNGTLSKSSTNALLYECNHLCKCGPACSNRLVQHGIQWSLTIFMTTTRGWGVRTNQKIIQGAFVAEHIGELITVAEADERSQSDSVYLFNLKPHQDRPTAYVIDSTIYGNVTRFFNHSCDPNLAVNYVYIESHDQDAPHIAFFARRDIACNEELTFDYNNGSGGSSRQVECKCGSKKCKQFLY